MNSFIIIITKFIDNMNIEGILTHDIIVKKFFTKNIYIYSSLCPKVCQIRGVYMATMLLASATESTFTATLMSDLRVGPSRR